MFRTRTSIFSRNSFHTEFSYERGQNRQLQQGEMWLPLIAGQNALKHRDDTKINYDMYVHPVQNYIYRVTYYWHFFIFYYIFITDTWCFSLIYTCTHRSQVDEHDGDNDKGIRLLKTLKKISIVLVNFLKVRFSFNLLN